MSFDKKAYMREYMRRKRAENPSYGQVKSDSSVETVNGNGYEEDFVFPELSFGLIILIIIVIVVVLLGVAYAYFRYFRRPKREEEPIL